MAHFQKAIKIQPNFENAHYNIGVAFDKLHEFQKAIACYEKAIQINPNYVAAYNNLGIIFNELKEFEKAKACYDKATQIITDASTPNVSASVGSDIDTIVSVVDKKVARATTAKTSHL